jgi:superfamily II DNA or RNA helicase
MSSLPTYHDLDPHQEELFDAVDDSLYTNGIFVSPTGSGKTFVIADTLYERALPDGGNVFVVLEPKIQLAMQQVQTFYERLEAANGEADEARPFRYMAVHSARTASDYLIDYAQRRDWDVADLPTHQFTSTTSPTDIASEVNKAQNSGENIVIVSTYDSAHRIAQAGVDVAHVFCDEAHHLVESDHHGVLDLFEAPYHHWTATPRYTNSTDGRGMNNTEKFGHVLERITMERIVEEGLVAKPRLNLVHGMGVNENPIENKYSVVKTIADDQENRIEYPPKIVFNCSGRDQLHTLAQAAAEDERFDDYLVAAISSEDSDNEDYGSWINGEKVSRSDWLETVSNESGKALVFHYDVVSEGIDVPGISGTVLFRSIGSMITNLQIMGRVMRLLEGERNVPMEDRLKTHADIYVPIIEDPFDDGQDMNSQFETYKNLLYALQAEGINIDPTETRAVVQPTGDSEEDENDPLDVTETEELADLLPDDVDDLTDVHNEVYEDVVEDERRTYLSRLRVNSDSVLEAIDFFEQDRESILEERERAELLLEHIYNQQNGGNYSSDHRITSSTYTPPELANSQVQKLVEAGATFDGAEVLVLNPEYIVQLFRNGFRPDEVTILCDDSSMRAVVRTLGMRFGIRVNIVTETDQIDDMKFDTVVGNPPYQKKVGPDKTEPMWDSFTNLGVGVTKEGGYVSLIHPSGWRNVSGKFKDTQRTLLSYDLKYLNMNDVDEGLKIFGATTPFDWYLLRKEKSDDFETVISTTEGQIVSQNLSNAEFIPNSDFEKIFSLIADEDEESVGIIHSWTSYETRKSYMNDEKTDEYVYPCVRYVYQDERGIDCYYSSTNENGHFGVPKVMVGQMADTGRITVDEDGTYGLTQFMFGIVDDPEKLPKIKEALDSQEFHRLMDACRFNRIMYNKKIISLLRKDFWKEFV